MSGRAKICEIFACSRCGGAGSVILQRGNGKNSATQCYPEKMVEGSRSRNDQQVSRARGAEVEAARRRCPQSGRRDRACDTRLASIPPPGSPVFHDRYEYDRTNFITSRWFGNSIFKILNREFFIRHRRNSQRILARLVKLALPARIARPRVLGARTKWCPIPVRLFFSLPF